MRAQLEPDARAATEGINKASDQAEAETDSEKLMAQATKAKGAAVASDLAKAAGRATKSLALMNLDEELRLARMELRRADEVIFGQHLGQGELGTTSLLFHFCVCLPSVWMATRHPLLAVCAISMDSVGLMAAMGGGRCASAFGTQSSALVATR